MGDFPHYFDIILFAMVAGFLILRLRSVLGRRTGQERRRNNPFLRQPEPTGDKVVPLGPRVAVPPPTATAPPGDAVAAGLAAIHNADPEFDPAHFVDGARVAFEMIVAAFAAGDKAKLRPLLSDEVYRPFSAAIDEREAAKETLETRILGMKQLDIAPMTAASSMAIPSIRSKRPISGPLRAIRARPTRIGHWCRPQAGDPDPPARI